MAVWRGKDTAALMIWAIAQSMARAEQLATKKGRRL
jgi:hypothetical protein